MSIENKQEIFNESFMEKCNDIDAAINELWSSVLSSHINYIFDNPVDRPRFLGAINFHTYDSGGGFFVIEFNQKDVASYTHSLFLYENGQVDYELHHNLYEVCTNSEAKPTLPNPEKIQYIYEKIRFYNYSLEFAEDLITEIKKNQEQLAINKELEELNNINISDESIRF